jgi:hypothetical protein
MKMEKKFEKGKHTGYAIGDILIHGHINNPDNWCLTIMDLNIHGVQLCSKSYSEKEIARCVYQVLRAHHNKLAFYENNIFQFT